MSDNQYWAAECYCHCYIEIHSGHAYKVNANLLPACLRVFFGDIAEHADSTSNKPPMALDDVISFLPSYWILC